jgi:copper chaperone
MITNVYMVTGMTCGHCASAVSAEVGELAGVTDVRVDLASGRVSVTSAGPLDDAAVRAAIVDAGYSVVGP